MADINIKLLPYGHKGCMSGTTQTAPWFFVFSVKEEEKKKELKKNHCVWEYEETYYLYLTLYRN